TVVGLRHIFEEAVGNCAPVGHVSQHVERVRIVRIGIPKMLRQSILTSIFEYEIKHSIAHARKSRDDGCGCEPHLRVSKWRIVATDEAPTHPSQVIGRIVAKFPRGNSCETGGDSLE